MRLTCSVESPIERGINGFTSAMTSFALAMAAGITSTALVHVTGHVRRFGKTDRDRAATIDPMGPADDPGLGHGRQVGMQRLARSPHHRGKLRQSPLSDGLQRREHMHPLGGTHDRPLPRTPRARA